MVKLDLISVAAIATAWVFVPRTAAASDWPQWRYNAQRGAVTAAEIPTDLTLHWQRELPPEAPAWPQTQTKLQFDVAAHIVASGRFLLVNSTVNDCVTAYDTRTGHERWRFYAEAPIRFAPIATHRRVYFVSDDSYLYCLELTTGKLCWRYQGAPEKRRILGNERLISSWPARGGPVLHDGKVFFAASIWPFMGIFIHAVDAESGSSVWVNSGDGTNLTTQPHGAASFATVVPQGHLAISGNCLIVPGGRSVPAVYDIETGRLLHFDYHGKQGGHEVFTAGDHYFVAGRTYDLGSGLAVEESAPALANEETVVFAAQQSFAGKSSVSRPRESKNRRGQPSARVARQTRFAYQTSEPLGKIQIQTGSLLWSTHDGKIFAYELKGMSPLRPKIVQSVPDRIWEMIAADDRLFVVTRKNKLLCFGPGQQPVERHRRKAKQLTCPSDTDTKAISNLVLSLDEVDAGYAVVLGVGTGMLIDRLLVDTQLHLIVLDDDANRIDQLRRRMQQAGLYGHRLSALANASVDELPAYLAQLIVSESRDTARPFQVDDILAECYRVLRPYGGKLCLPLESAQHLVIKQQAGRSAFHGMDIKRAGEFTIVHRHGALADSDDWSHQYGNAAQTGISLEHRVKAPLGVLWFGGPSHEGVLPRHGHGPSPQVAGGRIVIEGLDLLRCLDAYTGRLLWERKLKSLGHYYDNTRHFPGAGEIGGNYVTTPDHVYVVYGPSILKLNAATGTTEQEIQLPEHRVGANWGHLAVWKDLLIATSTPIAISTSDLSKTRSRAPVIKAGETAVIRPNATWRYLAGRDPSSFWVQPNFDDSGWKTGAAGFGYGDTDDTTELHDMAGNYNRVYIRKVCNQHQLDELSSLTLLIRYDDAFIAYLNGHEVARSSIESGRGSSAKVESHEAGDFELFEIRSWKKLLRRGENVFAIEGHNIGDKSSDFTLDPYLVGRRQSSGKSEQQQARLENFLQPTRYSSGSRRLIALNRHSGEKLWQRDAKYGFRHNNIAVGSGKVFCIDRFSDVKQRSLQRRGVKFAGDARLYALDARSGRVIWDTSENVFGTFLNYSEEHDTLVQGGSVYRDRAYDESDQGIVAYQGQDGSVLWEDPKLIYGGPCLLWQDQILTNGSGGFAIKLKTGEKTGWRYRREYGCNTAFGCQNLLTFRSGAAGFCDLSNDAGTGNLGGFRSSCTNNLIPANGILAVPDYTRTCNCAYQNQTSLALVHLPAAEFWTFGAAAKSGQIGINFGAPGDRRADNGTLWVDYPSVGGNSAAVNARILPLDVQAFRRHALTVSGELPWIMASGLEGVREIRIGLSSNARHTVRLFFLEPVVAADRRFDVKIQGKTWLPAFSPAKAAGGAGRGVIRSLEIKPVNQSAVIELVPRSSLPPVISGLEIIQEKS